MAVSPTTVRLNVAATLLKLEASLREIPVAKKTENDRRAVRSLIAARVQLVDLTDPPV